MRYEELFVGLVKQDTEMEGGIPRTNGLTGAGISFIKAAYFLKEENQRKGKKLSLEELLSEIELREQSA